MDKLIQVLQCTTIYATNTVVIDTDNAQRELLILQIWFVGRVYFTDWTMTYGPDWHFTDQYI